MLFYTPRSLETPRNERALPSLSSSCNYSLYNVGVPVSEWQKSLVVCVRSIRHTCWAKPWTNMYVYTNVHREIYKYSFVCVISNGIFKGDEISVAHVPTPSMLFTCPLSIPPVHKSLVQNCCLEWAVWRHKGGERETSVVISYSSAPPPGSCDLTCIVCWFLHCSVWNGTEEQNWSSSSFWVKHTPTTTKPSLTSVSQPLSSTSLSVV